MNFKVHIEVIVDVANKSQIAKVIEASADGRISNMIEAWVQSEESDIFSTLGLNPNKEEPVNTVPNVIGVPRKSIDTVATTADDKGERYIELKPINSEAPVLRVVSSGNSEHKDRPRGVLGHRRVGRK